jgi:ABC-type antimicrobial peptide transport system permease subunit
MKVVMLALVGLFLGAIVGGALGVGLALIWTEVFHTTSFEGYSGMLVFFTFVPTAVIVGALIGAAGLRYVASRDPATAQRDPV